jgi:hypothetical protein
MAGIGIGLAWAAYTGILWGYCLIRGYDVTIKQLMSSQWPAGVSGRGPQSIAPPGGLNLPTTRA